MTVRITWEAESESVQCGYLNGALAYQIKTVDPSEADDATRPAERRVVYLVDGTEDGEKVEARSHWTLDQAKQVVEAWTAEMIFDVTEAP